MGVKAAAETYWNIVYEQPTRDGGRRVVESRYVSWRTLELLKECDGIRIISQEEATI